MKRLVIPLALLLLAAPASAAEDFLDGAALEALIVGKTIRGEVYYESGERAFYAEYNDETGAVFSYTFLDGDAQSDFLYAESAGRWKIVGDKFCYRWQSAPDDVQCNVLAKQGYLYLGYEVLDQAKGTEADNLRLFFTIEAAEAGDQTGDLSALYAAFGQTL
jgi:hypothetical protein